MGKHILSHQEIAGFCRNLSLLLQAGISQSDGVFLIAEGEEEGFRNILTGIGEQLDQGTSLSVAVENSGVFPVYVTGMIQVGEQSGRVEEALLALAVYYEDRSRFTRMVKNALAYPAMILFLMLAVIAVLLIKVMPVFDEVYASLGSGLTGVAAGLLQLGEWLKAALPVLLILLAVVVIVVLLFSWCTTFREALLAGWRKFFGDRGLSAQFHNAQFARALSMGLNSGLALEESIQLARMLFADVPAGAARCEKCIKMLQEGFSLAETLRDCGFLSAASCRMLTVGIKGGNGDKVMTEIADRLMEEAGIALEKTVSRIEPAMVLLASGLVGAILLAVMLPLANIMSAIG